MKISSTSLQILSVLTFLEATKSDGGLISSPKPSIISNNNKNAGDNVDNNRNDDQDIVSSLIIENRTNEIITLEKIRKFPNVKTLSIRSSAVDEIEPGSLCFPENLTALRFIRNTKLPELTRETFEGCHSLTELYIDGAARIENGAFSDLTRLRTLRINDSTLPEVLSQDFLLGLGETLRNLEIKYSHLEEIETSFKSLGNLKFLSLSNNDLRRLPNGLFEGLVGLKSLDLSGNRFEDVDLGTFADLKSLRILFLDSNEFKEFDFGLLRVLPRLERVFFDRKEFDDDQLKETSIEVARNNVTLIWTGNRD